MAKQRLIDANALPYENQVLSCDDEWCLKVSDIDKAPTIDAVPVVCCGECARRYTELCALYAGQMNGKKYFVYKEDDFFCGKGQRLNDKFDGAKTITVPKWRGDDAAD